MGQEERDRRYREFLQGKRQKKLWFEIKLQICKHCIPSCHIKTATLDFKQVKFLNIIWDGCQKDWNDLNTRQRQIFRANKTGTQRLSDISNYDKSFCELGISLWPLFFKVGWGEKKKNRKKTDQSLESGSGYAHHMATQKYTCFEHTQH